MMNVLIGTGMLALSLVTAIAGIYVAGWLALLIMDFFENTIIPIFHK